MSLKAGSPEQWQSSIMCLQQTVDLSSQGAQRHHNKRYFIGVRVKVSLTKKRGGKDGKSRVS